MPPIRRDNSFFKFPLTILSSALCFGAAARAQQAPAPRKPANLAPATPLPECSLSKTNTACVVIIDRSNPVAPSTVQMYSGESVTVVVENPKSFERYFLDYQSGQATLKPDVASSIIQGLLPAFGKLQISSTESVRVNGVAPIPPCQKPEIKTVTAATDVTAVFPKFEDCMGYLANQAIDIYRRLEQFVAPDSRTPFDVDKTDTPEKVQVLIEKFRADELTFTNSVDAIAKLHPTPVAGDPTSEAVKKLGNMQKVADQVAADLAGYSQRITDLQPNENGQQACTNLVDVRKNKTLVLPAACVSITSNIDTPNVYQGMVTRTTTYALNVFNLISNPQEAAPDPSKKKLLATVAINFADSPKSARSEFRLEASAGAFFSTLPVRSFSAAPVFTNGVITDKKIVDNVIHPTVVPFAAANYRLTNDLPWSKWKSNFYLTGAVGINPNTVSADFATGLSYSYRALMLSALCHFGHEVGLTQGLTVGESLGPGFNGSIPTKTHWTESFAIGVSVRIPSLTGR